MNRGRSSPPIPREQVGKWPPSVLPKLGDYNGGEYTMLPIKAVGENIKKYNPNTMCFMITGLDLSLGPHPMEKFMESKFDKMAIWLRSSLQCYQKQEPYFPRPHAPCCGPFFRRVS